MRTIYIDVDEEITSVIERLAGVEASDVTLVIPKRSIILQSLVNLKLLKKEAERLNKNAHILTGDKLGKSLAQQAGIPTVSKETGEVENVPKKTANFGEDIEYRKIPINEVSTSDSPEDVEYLKKPKENGFENAPVGAIGTHGQKMINEAGEAKAELTKTAESTQNKKETEKKHESTLQKDQAQHGAKPKPKVSKKIVAMSVAGVLFIGLIFGWLSYPVAKIIITPKTEAVAVDFETTLKDQAQESGLSGQYIEVQKEKEQEFEATGKKDVGEKATGTVILKNSYATTAYAVPAGTKLTGGGKSFLTNSAVSVPGFTAAPVLTPGTTSVSVTAEAPGEEYNLAPTSFTVAGAPTSAFGTITASSSAAFSGGLKKQVTVVSGQDIENAKKTMTDDLVAQAKTEINNQKGDKQLIENSVQTEVTSFTTSSEKNAEATKFTAKIKTTSWTLVYAQSDYEKFVKGKLTEKAGATKELLEEGFESTNTIVSQDKGTKQINIKITSNGFAATKIDKEKIKKELVGKNKQEIDSYFSQNTEILETKTELSPSFFASLFKKARKIEITINVQKQ